MHLLSIILAAATASAIDIRLHTKPNCGDGGAWTCFAWNPDTCCGIDSNSASSIGFYGIPVDWNLEVRGHEGGACRLLRTLDTAYTVNFKCLTDGQYTGAGYGFRASKMKKRELCARHQAPDQYEEAGLKYSLSGLSAQQLIAFGEHVTNGTVAEVYQGLVVE